MFIVQDIGELTEIGTGRHWSIPDVQAQIDIRRQSLAQTGPGRGDKVLIHLGNRLEFLAELIAVWSLGACAIPVDSRLTPFEICKIAKAAGARLSIVDNATLDSTSELGSNILVLDTLREVGPSRKSQSYPSSLHLDDDARPVGFCFISTPQVRMNKTLS
jgi:acyl-CoA synthetase (AMP-forming)/AMP-acid ligase II